MSTPQPFTFPAANSTIAVTDTSQRVALPGGQTSTIVVKNVGASECFIASGDSSVTATAGGAATAASDGSFSIPPGEIGSYTISPIATHIAAICATGITTTLRISRGEGV